MVRKKSSKELGRGTMIIKSIEKTNATTPKSVISLKNLSELLILVTRFHPYYIF